MIVMCNLECLVIWRQHCRMWQFVVTYSRRLTTLDALHTSSGQGKNMQETIQAMADEMQSSVVDTF